VPVLTSAPDEGASLEATVASLRKGPPVRARKVTKLVPTVCSFLSTVTRLVPWVTSLVRTVPSFVPVFRRSFPLPGTQVVFGPVVGTFGTKLVPTLTSDVTFDRKHVPVVPSFVPEGTSQGTGGTWLVTMGTNHVPVPTSLVPMFTKHVPHGWLARALRYEPRGRANQARTFISEGATAGRIARDDVHERRGL
jgi:hypothetical protein